MSLGSQMLFDLSCVSATTMHFYADQGMSGTGKLLPIARIPSSI